MTSKASRSAKKRWANMSTRAYNLLRAKMSAGHKYNRKSKRR
jgi:hypothetical protein